MIRQYWGILSPFHGTFAVFVGKLVLYEGIQIAASYEISLIVRLFTDKAEDYFWVIFFACLLVFNEIFMRLDNAVDWHVVTKHSYPIYRFLKLSSVSKFFEMDIPWHQAHNSGTLVGKVNDGVWKVIELVDGLSWEFIPTLVQTLLSLIPLLIFSPITALISIAAFGVFFWMTVNAQKERQPYKSARHDLYEEEWHRSIEIVQAIETNIMFGQRQRLLAEQKSLHERIEQLGADEARVGIYKYNRWRIRVLTLTRTLIFVIWAMQLKNGSIDVANLIFVSVLTERLFTSFWRFARLLDRATEASEGASRLANLLGEQPQKDEGTLVPVVSRPLGIRMEGVRFAYESDYDSKNGALHDLNLEIPPGEIIALVGPSGAGKTTIRKIVTKLNLIQSGKVEVGGVDIGEWSHSELLDNFSYVPQGDDVFIFSGNLRDNIAFPKPQASKREVERAAGLAGIHDFIMTLPDGYETVVGERGKRLSGGQKQRVALARAIIADKPILILDEATSAVDAITEQEIQAKMRKILEGKTAIIIAHRLSTIWDIADKIVVLDQGRKVEEGTHKQLVAAGGLYARMVELQTA